MSRDKSLREKRSYVGILLEACLILDEWNSKDCVALFRFSSKGKANDKRKDSDVMKYETERDKESMDLS